MSQAAATAAAQLHAQEQQQQQLSPRQQAAAAAQPPAYPPGLVDGDQNGHNGHQRNLELVFVHDCRCVCPPASQF